MNLKRVRAAAEAGAPLGMYRGQPVSRFGQLGADA